MNHQNGICVAGNMLVDISYPVDVLPKSGELVPITGEAIRTTGGAVCNVAADLARLDPAMKITALGRIGCDAEGDLVLRYLGSHPNLDCSHVVREGTTSFTLVINENISRQRTFFTFGGAGDVFTEEDIPWDELDAKILHIGYILLLKALDQPDEEYGTRMARLLAKAREKGFLTSIDVVSESGDRFKRLVPPSLRYTDYCVINELETQATTGVLLRDDDGVLHPENMEEALKRLFETGVSTWAVIHCPEGAWGMEKGGGLITEASIALPKGYIKGKVGAGDAFCSGVLLAAAKGRSLAEAIHLGSAAAVISLRAPGATEGMTDEEEVLKEYARLETLAGVR